MRCGAVRCVWCRGVQCGCVQLCAGRDNIEASHLSFASLGALRSFMGLGSGSSRDVMPFLPQALRRSSMPPVPQDDPLYSLCATPLELLSVSDTP
jgi:hypothetical protein